MELQNLSPLLLSILLFSLLQTPTYAAQKSYIVYMGEHPYGANPTEADIQKATASHYNLLASLLKSPQKAETQMIYSYTRSINGFAAVLDEAQATELQKYPEVVSVLPNTERKLHTTRSWEFLGLESNGVISANSLWKKARFGRDIIIANLDTGAWPDSPSFNDKGYSPVPSKWKGICKPDGGMHCNRKLIGARYFNKGFFSVYGVQNSSDYYTARDTEGHGTHTLSTAGGGFVNRVSIFGHGNGTAKGGSPKSRVAAYKVCWPALYGGCFDADILAGFDAAINDGVDVISVSLGGAAVEFYSDTTAIGAFHAVRNGITVIASAGNEGPDPESVTNSSPWIFTVGASTMDREFTSYVTLGNKKLIKGFSLSEKDLPVGKFYPLITGADARMSNSKASDAQLCQDGTLDSKKAAGKIVVCIVSSYTDPVEQGLIAAQAGAAGIIVINNVQKWDFVPSSLHVLPASHISFSDGEVLFAYIISTKNPTASIAPVKTELGSKPAPIMTSFSSRGPGSVEPSVLKPDVVAPGFNVIASYPKYLSPSGTGFDKRQLSFIAMSGTSMSCPHVSGVVGLLRALHVDWSPAAIKSAIMTTAKTRANNKKSILQWTGVPANPFAYGAGIVQPNLAADPGLIYDLTVNDYLNFLCAHGYNASLMKAFTAGPYACPKNLSLNDFNYPSISVPNLNGPVTVTRRVKNVGSAGTYTARVRAPRGVFVSVQPTGLTFQRIGEEKTFKVTFKPAVNVQPRGYLFGQLIWTDGKHKVRSPLVVKHA